MAFWPSISTVYGIGSHSLLQGIFPTQGSNPGLPHCRWILYQLSLQGSPHIYIYIYFKGPHCLHFTCGRAVRPGFKLANVPQLRESEHTRVPLAPRPLAESLSFLQTPWGSPSQWGCQTEHWIEDKHQLSFGFPPSLAFQRDFYYRW